MILQKSTPAQRIVIWQPRYRDRTVLIAAYKLGIHNEITFTKAPSMEGVYYISGEEARKYPRESNGKLDVYAVPLDKLEKLERE